MATKDTTQAPISREDEDKWIDDVLGELEAGVIEYVERATEGNYPILFLGKYHQKAKKKIRRQVSDAVEIAVRRALEAQKEGLQQ